MAGKTAHVGSFWQRLLGPVRQFVASRTSGAQRHAARANHYFVELRGWEALEDRRLLAAEASSIFLDFSNLQPVPYAFDSLNLLVRFDEAVQDAADYLMTSDDSALDGVEMVQPLSLVPGLQHVRLGEGFSIDAALATLEGDPHVLYAEPDYALRLADVATDPLFSEQWDFHNIGQTGGVLDADIDAPEAWDVTTGTGSTIVAVIDTGVDYMHPDLAANIWTNADEIPNNGLDDDGNGYIDDVHGYDFYNDDGDPMDDHNHGTHVAGTIGAVGNNGAGVAGVNWDVQIMALKFLGADGSGTTSDAIEAVRYAVDNGAHISNNSWGGDPYSQALFDAISDAGQAGHIFVAAAGNGNFFGIGQNNDASPFYPASYNLDNIVAVAATDDSDLRAVFSNYGATSVDLGAPGVSILSTTRNGTYGYNSGTSMAAPHVTGALSLVRDFDPGLTYRQIIDRVLASVDPVASLAGRTVTGGRLNVAAALVPDTFGPQIAGIVPSGLTLDPTDNVLIVFDESIDASTFTLADVDRFAGPNGDIGPLSLSAVPGTNNRQFTLSFPLQTTPGDYELEISPGILDRFGNVMDQDDDGVGGELLDDRYVGGFTLADTVARFDFGTVSSPVAAGYTRVTRYDRYEEAAGFGWQVGSVADISRSNGTDLTRDVNFSHDATFALDLAAGEYDLIVTLGDTSLTHDNVGVFLEGVQVDTVTTAAGQTVAKTYRVTVSDGQLNLRLADLGGSDYWAMINGLDVVAAGPDVTGPQITSADPIGTVEGPIDRITVNFSETIDESSFTVDDVLVLEGPAGAITPAEVNRVGLSQYEVTFAPQNTSGLYRLVLGADIADGVGNLLDQDGDGTGGENPDDSFETTFTLEAGPEYVARFDYGTTSSPVAQGYTQVTRYSAYDAATGYGWQEGSVSDIARGSGTDLTRDVNFTHDATFALDLAPGEYDVIATLGDTSLAHDDVGVFLEGVQVDTVTTAGGQTVTNTYRVSVSDGQLNLRLADLGGSDYWAMINGLDVVFVGPDVTGPQITSADPVGTVAGPVDRITINFSESIDENSFTVADVMTLEGPAGAITPAEVNRLSGGQYEVVFASQNTSGLYRLELGADIADGSGNLLDQDGDGTGGENQDDWFETTFTLEAGPAYVARFDYGTDSSPVAEGYTQLTRYDRYDEAIGYGWQVGSVAHIERGSGTDLTRDVNFSHDATFALDLANGDYDVIATLGDTSLAHDQVGVFLEGVQVDTVTTAGGETVTRTYQVSVSDGQLNLRLADLGGSDYWAMINALEVIAVGGAGQGGGGAAVAAADAVFEVREEPQPAFRSASFVSTEPTWRTSTSSVESHGRLDRFDLLAAVVSSSRRHLRRDALHAAHDDALVSLFGDSSDRPWKDCDVDSSPGGDQLCSPGLFTEYSCRAR